MELNEFLQVDVEKNISVEYEKRPGCAAPPAGLVSKTHRAARSHGFGFIDEMKFKSGRFHFAERLFPLPRVCAGRQGHSANAGVFQQLKLVGEERPVQNRKK